MMKQFFDFEIGRKSTTGIDTVVLEKN